MKLIKPNLSELTTEQVIELWTVAERGYATQVLAAELHERYEAGDDSALIF